jgi:hypothetical protein
MVEEPAFKQKKGMVSDSEAGEVGEPSTGVQEPPNSPVKSSLPPGMYLDMLLPEDWTDKDLERLQRPGWPKSDKKLVVEGAMKVLGGPSVDSDGDVVRVVSVAGKAVPEIWRNGAWVRGGDPAMTAYGRPLSASEVAALPKSSSR